MRGWRSARQGFSNPRSVEIAKDLGRSDWGAMFLTPDQLSYSKNDVRYLHRLNDGFPRSWEKQSWQRSFGSKPRCSQPSRVWKQADLPSMPIECALCARRLMPGWRHSSPRSARALTTRSLTLRLVQWFDPFTRSHTWLQRTYKDCRG
jgi:hypothetical protein